jgi:hypothetical protein
MVRSLLLFFLLSATAALAQQNDVPLQRDFYIDVERNAAKLDARVHTGLKPVLERRADLTNVMGHRVDSAKYYYWLSEKIFKEHFLIVDDGDFHLTVDPLFNIEYGWDPGDVTPYSDTNRYFFNTRGFVVAGDLGKKISFRTMFHENQALVPQYLYVYAQGTGVVPGQARAKFEDARKIDFGWSQANVSYSPVEWLNLQFGHGRHFVGHGYRSVLLSDHAINAPYFKASIMPKGKRWQYSTWLTKVTHSLTKSFRLPTGESSESLFYWKRARYNHLSVDLGRVQLGLFEATIFRTIDSSGVRPFDAMELNPIIGTNTLLYGFDDENKTLAGLDLRVKATDRIYAYGQFAVDGPDRYAWQAGVRAFDVGRKDLHVQLEYSTATPFMYMGNPAVTSYLQSSLPMAHPLGTAFSEMVGIVDAGFGRFWLQGKVNYAQVQRDVDVTANNGTNLFLPAVPDTDGPEPITYDLFYLDANASYLLNPNTNLRFVVGCMRRDMPNMPDGQQSTYVYAAVRTHLFNRYYDL